MACSMLVQRDNEFRRELLQLQEIFDKNLRRYDGNDPLDNWYEYVLKTEEVYLKYGKSTNDIIPILEQCLKSFEENPKYTNDRRFSKLWIKYIDLQPNQIELCQILYSKGMCRQCADLYCAWALYYEINGNFKEANNVYEMGMCIFAQPYEQLVIAHKNMIFMAGLQMIYGLDEQRLNQRKQVLASLHRNGYHQQTIFTTAHEHHPLLPFRLVSHNEQNQQTFPPQGGILNAIRNRENVENRSSTMNSPMEPQVVIRPNGLDGIRLYPDFYSTNHDDFSNWHVDLCCPEEVLPSTQPMYPKHLVYNDGTEYSLEEIRARRYLVKMRDSKNNNEEKMNEDVYTLSPPTRTDNSQIFLTKTDVENNQNSIDANKIHSVPVQQFGFIQGGQYQQPYQNFQQSQNFHPHLSAVQNKIQSPEKNNVSQSQQNYMAPPPKFLQVSQQDLVKDKINNSLNEDSAIPNAAAIWQNTHTNEESTTFGNLWKGSFREQHIEIKKPTGQPFKIHEDTKLLTEDARSPVCERDQHPISHQVLLQNQQERVHRNFSQPNKYVGNRGTPFGALSQPETIEKMPTEPFREDVRENMNRDEFIQPCEIKKKPLFEDDVKQIFSDDACLNTQVFNGGSKFISTPLNPKKIVVQQYASETKNYDPESLKANRQRLFCESEMEDNVQQNSVVDKLSVIYETTKELCSSSGSSGSASVVSVGGTTLKTNFNAHGLKTIRENAILQVENNTIHSKNYQIPNPQLFEYSQHSIYNQHFRDERLIGSPNVMRNVVHDVPDQSYGVNLKDSYLLGTQNRTPSPRSDTLLIPNATIESYTTENNRMHPSYTFDGQITAPFPKNLSNIRIGECAELPNENTDNLMRLSEIAEQHSQLRAQNQYAAGSICLDQRSPSKDVMCFEGSNDSNSLKDFWRHSPAKGSRMDIDVMTQHSISDLRMDYDICPEPLTKDDLVLLKTPSDPFCGKLIRTLLKKVGFPNQRHKQNYVMLHNLPRIIKKEIVSFGEDKYAVGTWFASGNYGTVFRATRLTTNEVVALKLQKPPNQWEFYICSEIQNRIVNPHLLKAFMSIQVGYFSLSSSILVSEFSKYGSLLDISNKVKKAKGKGMRELPVIYFANEIMTIVNALHQCRIIHADIKPDNFLVMRLPPEFGHPCLQLIDFGCSIDMSLFPKDTQFTKVINTENFICTEMKDGRPWTYQTDLFCIASTVHVLLFEKYMEVQKRGSDWSVTTHFPRYLNSKLWSAFFHQLLNIESSSKLPDINAIKHSFEKVISENSDDLQKEMRCVANCATGR